MANVYVEPRLNKYAVRTAASVQLAEFESQQAAVDWANQEGHTVYIKRGGRRTNYGPGLMGTLLEKLMRILPV